MKSIVVCVNPDIVHSITWAMKEFDGKIKAKYLQKLRELRSAVESDTDCCTVILDAYVQREYTLDEAKALKNEIENLKILLVVSQDFSKEDLVNVIQAKIADGVIVRPFTAEKVTDNIYNLCNFKKPSAVPWYEHKKMP